MADSVQAAVRAFDGIRSAKHLQKADALTLPAIRPRLTRATLSGRLTEICGENASAVLTSALGLVRDAQEQGETTAWVTPRDSLFFPPDAADGGVDLPALALVRVPSVSDVPRAADKLARSGAFGLIVLDLEAPPSLPAQGKKNPKFPLVPAPLLARLLGLAKKHDVAVVFLTRKRSGTPSIGSLISLRGQTRRTRIDEDRFEIEVKIVKDKRRAPNWRHAELCRGPAGLR